MEKLFTIVPAAGRGERLGAGLNKMYSKVAGIPLLVRTLMALNDCPSCHEVALAVRPDEIDHIVDFLAKYKKNFSNLRCTPVLGGEERQYSVFNAFKSMPECYEYVAIHDGARPFISPEVFERVYAEAIAKGAAIAAIQVHDTVKFVRNGLVESTASRKHIFFAQTPQIFAAKVLRAAIAKAEAEGFLGTDDSSLMENFGYRVSVVEGEADNLKITTPANLAWATMKLGAE